MLSDCLIKPRKKQKIVDIKFANSKGSKVPKAQ